MELIARCAATGLFASCACLLLKRTNPEIALLAAVTSAAVILAAALRSCSAIKELTAQAQSVYGISSTLIEPVLKCSGISMLSFIGAGLCKDAGQATLSAAIELAATLCAAAAAIPTILTMLKMIGEMV